MSVTVNQTVIDLGASGLRGRDGLTGDYFRLTQTNSSGSAIQAEVPQEGSTHGILSAYGLLIRFTTEADTISLEVDGVNAGDPRLIKLAGGAANLNAANLVVGDFLMVVGRPVDPEDLNAGITHWELLAPGIKPANSAQTLAAMNPGLGSGSEGVVPQYLGDLVEALGVMMNRLHLVRPTKSKPFTAMRMSLRRWWVLTFVEGGGRMDYAVHEFQDSGASQSPAISTCWRYNGCIAFIDGLKEDFAIFTGEDIGSGQMDSLPPPTWEPVFRVGPHTSHPTGFDYVGESHGHLSAPSCGIYLNGATGTNYQNPADAPIGLVLRGTAFQWDQAYTVLLPDNVTVAGTLTRSHVMVTGGVQISGRFTVTGSNIGMTTLFGGLMSGRGDRLKGNGITAITVNRENGLEYGAGDVQDANLGELTQLQLYTLGRETHILETYFPGAGPVGIDGAAYGWAANDSNRDSFAQDRTEGYVKVYVHGVNKSASWLVDGKTFDFNVIYRARKGSLV